MGKKSKQYFVRKTGIWTKFFGDMRIVGAWERWHYLQASWLRIEVTTNLGRLIPYKRPVYGGLDSQLPLFNGFLRCIHNSCDAASCSIFQVHSQPAVTPVALDHIKAAISNINRLLRSDFIGIGAIKRKTGKTNGTGALDSLIVVELENMILHRAANAFGNGRRLFPVGEAADN